MRPNFYVLNSSELVKAYNDMASEAATLELSASPVKRFSTRDAGIRRIEALYHALCDKKGEEYQQPEPPEPQSIDASPLTEGETPKQTKTKKKSKAKKEKKSKKVAKGKADHKRSERSEIVETCKVNGGTKRARALDYLYARIGKQCSATSIMTAVYGSSAEETSTSAFYTVMKALTQDIEKSKAKYIVQRAKDEKGIVSYVLYSSKNGNGNP
jgi:hypothetical protein